MGNHFRINKEEPEKLKDMYRSFIKVCDYLNKITTERVWASNGVFMWRSEGIISISTFSEKLERDIIPFLVCKFRFNPSRILFMDKFFQINTIEFTEKGIELAFDGDSFKDALDDKRAEDVLMSLIKKNDSYVMSIDFISDSDTEFNEICKSIYEIGETGEFDKSELIDDLDKSKLMKGDRPVEIDKGEFNTRIAKSVFQSINTNDKISFRCTPYKDNKSIFLCTATVSKDHCQVINIYNALHI